MNETEWRTMLTAPKNATEVRVRMADGHVFERAHWASDLSGEEQPPFRGWFVPVMNSDGRFLHYAGISEPSNWMPIAEKVLG